MNQKMPTNCRIPRLTMRATWMIAGAAALQFGSLDGAVAYFRNQRLTVIPSFVTLKSRVSAGDFVAMVVNPPEKLPRLAS